MRRFIAYLLAALVAASSVVTPARAFAPVAVLAAPAVVGGGGTSYAMGALLGMIGAALAYMEIQDSNGNAARIPLKDAPEAQPPAPAAPATATGSQGTDTTAQETSCSGFAAWKLTGGLGCGTTWAIVPLANGTQYYCRAFYASGAPCSDSEYKSIPQTLVCPAGYTKSGSSCVLSNPRQATPDKKCDLQFSAGKYLYYNDADCPSGPSIDHSKAVPGLRSDGDVVFVPGKDANGNPLIVKVLQQRDSQTGVVTERALQVYKQSGANVDTTTITLTPDAVVKTATQTSAPGQLTSPTTSPTAASTPDNATTTPQAQTDPTKPPVVETCGLPGKPACAVDDTGFTGKDSFITPKLADIATAQDAMKTGVENSKDFLPSVDSSWLPSLMPGSAVACKPVPYQAKISHGPLSGFDHTENLDICPQLDIVRQILGYLMFVVTVWRVWRIFARSNQGE